MAMTPGQEELYAAILYSATDGCAENLKRIVEARCTLSVRKAYDYVRNFKDMEIIRSAKKHAPLIIKINKQEECNATTD